jgi:ATP-binding cassette subfamily C (CFTR/MRP) protein 1
LILYAANSSVRTPASLAAGALVVADALGLCLLSHAEHVHSIRPSTIINVYLFITLLFDIAHTRTLWIEHAPKSIAAVFTVTVIIKFIVAIMEATEKRKILLAQYQHKNQEATSGIYSRALFWWLNTLLTIGFRRIIRKEDLFPMEDEMSSSVLASRAKRLWNTSNKTRSHALCRSTLNSNRRQLALCILPRLCLIGFRYAQPLLLSRTTEFVSSTTDKKNIGWGLTGAFGIVFLGLGISKALYSHMAFRSATAVRGTLVSMIYAKTVDLNITSLDESAAVTLMSNDTGKCCTSHILRYNRESKLTSSIIETICGCFENLHEIWAVPIELVIAMWLLYRELGLSFIPPAALAIISTCSVAALSAYVGKSQKIWNQGIQTRVDVTTSILGSMKVSPCSQKS